MQKVHYLKLYREKAKVVIHKAGQLVFKPLWNRLPERPFYESLALAVFLTKICNANCIFCAYQFIPVSQRIQMPDNIFSRIAQGIKKIGILSVHFTSQGGEPLMVDDLLDKIEILRRAGVQRVELTTNAILLDKFGIDKFLEEGPDIINISTSAFDADMYARIFRSNQFERMRSNVMNLLTRNRLRHKPRLITIGIRPDISRKDVLAMPETQDLIRLADNIDITQLYGDWLGLIKEPMLSGTMKLEKPIPISDRPCRILLDLPAIHPNGDILACACRNINNDPSFYLGNILTDELGDALNNLNSIIKNWQNGLIPKVCRSCTMYGDPSYYWIDYLRRLLSIKKRDSRQIRNQGDS